MYISAVKNKSFREFLRKSEYVCDRFSPRQHSQAKFVELKVAMAVMIN